MSRLKPDLEFVSFLTEVGSDFSLTQGLGGNCSIKSEGTMLVKASGKRLGDASLPDYFYKVGVSEGEYFELKSPQAGKPSIEVFLHAMLPHKYVVHLHSTKGVALSMMSAHDSQLRETLEELGISIIEYRRPGVDLKQAISSKVDKLVKNPKTTSFLLQNHGTLFGANSVSEIRDEVLRLEHEATLNLGVNPISSIQPDNLDLILEPMDTAHVQWHARNNWRISPDHVVFLGPTAPQGLLQEFLEKITVGNLLKSVFPELSQIGPREEQLLWFMNVVRHLPKRQFPTLSEDEASELLSWELEQHRVKTVYHAQ